MLETVSFLNSEAPPNYAALWNFQKERVEAIANGESAETLIFCEHERVITGGRRYKEENIRSSEFPFYAIERGGDVTYHGPGQLVVYPLLRLNGSLFRSGLHEYLRFCEAVLIRVLNDFGLDAGRFGPTGVWIKSNRASGSIQTNSIRKIASLGIAVKRWVTYHGLALNVSSDLSDFQAIRPCDFNAEIMTSLKAEGVEISLQEVAKKIEAEFRLQLLEQSYLPLAAVLA